MKSLLFQRCALSVLRTLALCLTIALTLTTMTSIQAADEVVHFDNPDHRAMYQDLLKEYRCLKCQNQNLWDSNAQLAGDLRREIREQIVSGKEQNEIDAYLVARYGEFVLYRPRFNAKTALLWTGPFVLLGIGLITLVMMARGRARDMHENDGKRIALPVTADPQAENKLAKARELLKD